MTCPLSPTLEMFYQDEESEYAKEGTDAHLYGELWLLDDKAGMEAFRAVSAYYNAEMHYYVGEFVEEVERRYAGFKAISPDAVLMPEQYLRYDKWVHDGFGTGDVTLIAPGVLEIIDLKYGKGVPVKAQNNPQIRIYGLAAYDMFSHMFDNIHTIRLTIVQPRLDSVTSEDISVEKLLHWADTVLRPAGYNAWKGIGKRVAGSHCRFCKAKVDCGPYKVYRLEEKKKYIPKDMTLEDAINDFM